MERGGIAALRDHEVDGLRAAGLDVRAGGVEVRVVGHGSPGAAEDAEQDLLRGAPLMRGDDVAEREQARDAVEELEPGRRAGVAFVAVLDRRPLVAGHRAGARIGQEVDQDIVRVEVEQVVPGRLERRLALLHRGQPDGLHRVDPERLDDRAPRLHEMEDRSVRDARAVVGAARREHRGEPARTVGPRTAASRFGTRSGR
jgi:hypothetical protein